MYMGILYNILFHTAPIPQKPMKYETQNIRVTMVACCQCVATSKFTAVNSNAAHICVKNSYPVEGGFDYNFLHMSSDLSC
jgi:hypothetical protein